MPALFPENNLDDLVSGWLTQATSEVNARGIEDGRQNDAVLSWVYWRAYDHISLRMANEFASKVIHSGAGDATVSQTNDQRKFFQDRAAYYRDRFQFNSPTPSDTAAVFYGGSSLSARFNGEL